MKTVRELPDRDRPGPKPGRVGVDWPAKFGAAKRVARGRRVWVCVGEWDNRYSPAKVKARVAHGDVVLADVWELEVRREGARWGLWGRLQAARGHNDESGRA